jgi:hypothetical protein
MFGQDTNVGDGARPICLKRLTAPTEGLRLGETECEYIVDAANKLQVFANTLFFRGTTMGRELVLFVGPQEEELATKRAELERLQTHLANRELFLTNLRSELSAFQRRYLREVGALYAELDDLSDRLVQWLSENESSSTAGEEWDAKIAELADEESQQAEFSFSAAWAQRSGSRRNITLNGEESEEFLPTSELKSLYREVAKRVHPDLAANDTDRHKREMLMKRANGAYQRGDLEALRRVLEEYENSPESVQGKGLTADLARVTRQIKQIVDRLSRIEAEVAHLRKSDIGKLRTKADAAAAEGGDLLAEMAADLRRRIEFERKKSVRAPS